MTSLCLTLDYELFGSGKGNVFQHMIEPTNKLLEICKKYDIRLSIFFEVVEYWKIKEYYEKGIAMGYDENPVKAIEEQIKRAYNEGHDVQMHLHPQWIDAKYENGTWKLNMDYWRIPEVPKMANADISMGRDELICKGKQTIEDLLQPINSEYQCNVFRAGGYNTDPSDQLIKSLRKHGFVADASVYSGGKMMNELSRYDYSSVTNEIPYWSCKDSFLDQDKYNLEGMIELPLFAQSMRRIFKYDLIRVKTALRNKEHSMDKFKSNSVKKSKWETLKFFLGKEAVIWDFCLFSKGKMRKYMKRALKVKEHSAYDFHPFLLVGHPKDFQFSDGIEWLGKYADKHQLAFLTLTDCIKEIQLRQVVEKKLIHNYKAS